MVFFLTSCTKWKLYPMLFVRWMAATNNQLPKELCGGMLRPHRPGQTPSLPLPQLLVEANQDMSSNIQGIQR